MYISIKIYNSYNNSTVIKFVHQLSLYDIKNNINQKGGKYSYQNSIIYKHNTKMKLHCSTVHINLIKIIHFVNRPNAFIYLDCKIESILYSF